MAELSFEPSSRKDPHHVNRAPDRAKYDEKTVYEIIDENMICHVSFKVPRDDYDLQGDDDDWPVVIPMGFGRIGSSLYLHGHVSSRLMTALATPGARACVTFTSVQGLILARSAFHNSFFYRSAIVYGPATFIPDSDRATKNAALTAVTNQPFKATSGADRWADSREASEAELKTTKVVKVDIDMASAKVNAKGPNDEKSDLENEGIRKKYWAGAVRRKNVWEVDPCGVGVEAKVPDYVKALAGSSASAP